MLKAPVRSMLCAGTIAVVTACGGPTELTVENLEGVWNAAQYIYTNQANSSETVDIITLGASLQVTVAADGTVSSLFRDSQGGTSSDSGNLNTDGTRITLAGVVYDAELSASTLMLQNDASAYDFDSDGTDDPASLEIRLSRQ